MNRLINILIGVLIAMAILAWSTSSKYLDWLWYKSVGSTSVFWIPLLTGPVTKLIIGLLIFGFLILNLWLALRAFTRVHVVSETDIWPEIPKNAVLLPALGVAAVLSFVLASGLTLDWTLIQQFLHQIPTGVKDPIFGKYLGFYLFAYPFYQRLNSLLSSVAFLSLAGTAVLYFIAKAFWQEGRNWELWQPAKTHLTVLAILFFLTKIWGYSLGRFDLLYQETAQMTGINYTAYHAKLFGLQVLSIFLAIVIAIFIFNLFRKGTKLLIGGVAAWLLLSFLLLAVYPGLMQSFRVAPNEYSLEEPFLKNHINFTRKAYGLDKIKIQAYSPKDSGTAQLNPANPALADLRLWDYRPLHSSYNQLQKIRPYYNFNDIDIDRYPTPAGQRQVMLSARELNTAALDSSAQNWINIHMTYTHGYGIAANQVNQFTSQGQPLFIARDLPTKTEPTFPGLKVDQPRVYYGETTNSYAIVDTKNAEFDYPQGEGIASNNYDGKKGIPLNSPFNRLLMTAVFGDTNFLLSNLITPESSILLYRNINTRVRKLAPFLTFDKDPYLVVSGGKLYWIIDAYTTSSAYPYAKFHNNDANYLNYIRNSVKAVVDAYSGEVNFYVVDPTDPLIKVWQKIFPSLFKPAAAIAPDLARHFRYPEMLMEVQRDLISQYHMTNTKSFYGKEDYWEIPVHNQDDPFDPYYVTLQLPGSKNPEFVMMQPFSPRGSRNLVSWMVARCDEPNYGEVLLYVLPKDQNIYGPAQIDSRINQDQNISQLVTLWNQQSSKVTWGNLLIVPIDGSILYVKPLFMESERSQQAELKKVVMVYQNQVAMGDTLADALSKLTLAPGPSAGTSNTPNTPAQPTQPQQPNPASRRAEILKRLNELTREQQRLLQELSNTQ